MAERYDTRSAEEQLLGRLPPTMTTDDAGRVVWRDTGDVVKRSPYMTPRLAEIAAMVLPGLRGVGAVGEAAIPAATRLARQATTPTLEGAAGANKTGLPAVIERQTPQLADEMRANDMISEGGPAYDAPKPVYKKANPMSEAEMQAMEEARMADEGGGSYRDAPWWRTGLPATQGGRNVSPFQGPKSGVPAEIPPLSGPPALQGGRFPAVGDAGATPLFGRGNASPGSYGNSPSLVATGLGSAALVGAGIMGKDAKPQIASPSGVDRDALYRQFDQQTGLGAVAPSQNNVSDFSKLDFVPQAQTGDMNGPAPRGQPIDIPLPPRRPSMPQHSTRVAPVQPSAGNGIDWGDPNSKADFFRADKELMAQNQGDQGYASGGMAQHPNIDHAMMLIRHFMANR